MPDIFDEVEEDLRAERAQSILRRYGGVFVLGAVVILAGTGGYVWWTQQRQAERATTANAFIAAATLADKSQTALAGVDKAAATDAEQRFAKLAAGSSGGYRVLARLRLAAVQWELGKKADAIANWRWVSDDSAAPRILRDLATIVSAQHQVDTADPIMLKQTMEGLTGADNPWRPLAQQVIALIDLRQGKPREAAALFKRIAGDPAAPEGVRGMASDLLTTLPDDSAAAPDKGNQPAPAAGGSAPTSRPPAPAQTAPSPPGSASAPPKAGAPTTTPHR